MRKIAEVLEIFGDFCRQTNTRFEVHAGFALFLYKCYDKVADVDIRVYTSDLKNMMVEIKEIFGEYKMVLRGPVYLRDRAYLNNAIILETNDMKFDICSEIITARDEWVYRLPFNLGEGQYVEIDFQNMKIPVASLNSLLLYYLTLRRDQNGFNDYLAIKSIILHPNFKFSDFNSYIEYLYYRDNILDILKNLNF